MNLDFDKPGNFYYFIEASAQGKTKRVTWHDGEQAPQSVLDLYKHLIQLTTN